jgi:hypothetical protein
MTMTDDQVIAAATQILAAMRCDDACPTAQARYAALAATLAKALRTALAAIS